MSRDPVEIILGVVEQPVQPRRQFSDALLERLLIELGDGSTATNRIRAGRRIWRLAPVAAAAVVAAIVAVVSIFPRPQSAYAIVEKAIFQAASLPPLRATFSYEETGNGRGVYSVAYQSRTMWRIDTVARRGEPAGPGNFAEELSIGGDAYAGQGDYVVSDGTRQARFLAAKRFYFSQSLELGHSPLGQLAWQDPFAGPSSGIFPSPAPGGPVLVTWRSRCVDSKVFGDTYVAGRTARHVRCGDWELWIDADTGLILKVRTDAYVAVITRIEYRPEFAVGTFSTRIPQGACDRGTGGDRPDDPQWCLTIGEVAPEWKGPLLGGGSFDLAAARGRPVVVLFWNDSYQPGELPSEALGDFNSAFGHHGDRVNFVVVDSFDNVTAQRARRILAQLGYRFPVVLDRSPVGGKISTLWGPSGVPAWVILNRDGVIVGLRFGRLPQAQMDALLALASK
jgi:AhpC/TSA family